MMYDRYFNTHCKNCLKMINSNKREEKFSQTEASPYPYLKKYIRQSDETMSQSLLPYCTVVNIPTNNIPIAFTHTEGIHRVPNAHACTGLQ